MSYNIKTLNNKITEEFEKYASDKKINYYFLEKDGMVISDNGTNKKAEHFLGVPVTSIKDKNLVLNFINHHPNIYRYKIEKMIIRMYFKDISQIRKDKLEKIF